MNGNELGRVVVLIHMDLDLLDLAQRLILRNVYALLREWHFTAVGLDTSVSPRRLCWFGSQSQTSTAIAHLVKPDQVF